MNITSGLRRTISPTVPMVNSTAPSTRYHVSVTWSVRHRHSGISRSARHLAGPTRPPGQHHGATTAITSSTDVISKANR